MAWRGVAWPSPHGAADPAEGLSGAAISRFRALAWSKGSPVSDWLGEDHYSQVSPTLGVRGAEARRESPHCRALTLDTLPRGLQGADVAVGGPRWPRTVTS